MADLQTIPAAEAVKLGAADVTTFGQIYLPRAFRQGSAPFHKDIAVMVDNPDNRYVGIQVFRGGAKTTLLRTIALRRICYGIDHSVLYLGKSEEHAHRSVAWIRDGIENNPKLRNHFGIHQGDVWTGGRVQIKHSLMAHDCFVLGLGITGSIRGINELDYRPSLIILDDIIDDENAATPEQRLKINERVFGAIKESLAPRSEIENATLVMLQTPLDVDDASELVQRDSEWASLRYGIFTDGGFSRWEERYPTEEQKREKQSAVERNMLSLWMREKECSVIADESRYFRKEWLETVPEIPHPMLTAIAVDPSPPRDEDPEKRKTKDPDPEVVAVCGYHKGVPFVVETSKIVDPNPEKTWQEIIRLRKKYKPMFCAVETVAFQRTLQWYFERRMRQTQTFFRLVPIDDKRSKHKRIRHTLTQFSTGIHYLGSVAEPDFYDQFVSYPSVRHDDTIDAVAIAFQALQQENLAEEEDFVLDESQFADISEFRSAP